MQPGNANENARYLLQKAYDAGIRDPRELSIFMGQTEVESAGFHAHVENLHYRSERLLEKFGKRLGIRTVEQAEAIIQQGPEAVGNAIYGGKWGVESLGNTEPGDGWAFRGRGYIQITGRDNYEGATKRTGIDFANNPDLAAINEYAALTAIDFWKEHVVRNGARNDVIAATRIINSGAEHLPERIAAATRWREALTPDVLHALSRGEISPEAREAKPGQETRTRKGPGETRDTPAWPRGNIDETLMRNIRTTLAHAEQGNGKPWDEASERMSASLYGVARERGFTGADELRVAFNLQTDRYRAGELVFLQRIGPTASPDPYENRVHLPTSEAIARPASQVMQEVQAQDMQRVEQQSLALQGKQTQEQDAHSHRMRMG